MITLDVKTDIAQALAKFAKLEPRQLPFIVSVAMNRTMRRIKDDERKEMARVFDRPTPFTLNSLATQVATKQKLEASIRLKDFAGKGVPASKYLAPEIYGGKRPYKRFERALAAAGLLPDGLYAVPAQGVVLDAYGNLKGSYLTRILSYLRASSDPTQNRATRQRRKTKGKPQQFFAITDASHRLPMGIYERSGGRIHMVIAYVKAPTYTERFKFYQVGQETTSRYLVEELRIAAAQALATSRDAGFTLADINRLLK